MEIRESSVSEMVSGAAQVETLDNKVRKVAQEITMCPGLYPTCVALRN